MKIYITTEFDISTLSFQVHPTIWNVELAGEDDPKITKTIPGYSLDEQSRDTWTVEISIDNGRIRNWPHGIDAVVSLFDPDGIYLIEDDYGNSITYTGVPPEILRIEDDKNLSISIDENGYIRNWKVDLSLLKEWGTIAKFSTQVPDLLK